jgi:protein tyrosine phosphatase
MAPTNSTLADWWTMIWQEEVVVILMLCGVSENGRAKCAQYWPERTGETSERARRPLCMRVLQKRTAPSMCQTQTSSGSIWRLDNAQL